MTPEELANDVEWVKRYRGAISKSKWVILPDGRDYMVMWRIYEQFGVRHLETAEQYSFTYEDAVRLGIMPLVLCPIDIANTPGF